MSKAVNTLDPRYSTLTIGVCPDQWGVWFPQDPKQIPWETALQEMSDQPAPGSSVSPALR